MNTSAPRRRSYLGSDVNTSAPASWRVYSSRYAWTSLGLGGAFGHPLVGVNRAVEVGPSATPCCMFHMPPLTAPRWVREPSGLCRAVCFVLPALGESSTPQCLVGTLSFHRWAWDGRRSTHARRARHSRATLSGLRARGVFQAAEVAAGLRWHSAAPAFAWVVPPFRAACFGVLLISQCLAGAMLHLWVWVVAGA